LLEKRKKEGGPSESSFPHNSQELEKHDKKHFEVFQKKNKMEVLQGFILVKQDKVGRNEGETCLLHTQEAKHKEDSKWWFLSGVFMLSKVGNST
jgi:hypothetical protein